MTSKLFPWRPWEWLTLWYESSWYDGPWTSLWLGPFGSFHTTPDWYIDWKAVRAREKSEGGVQQLDR